MVRQSPAVRNDLPFRGRFLPAITLWLLLLFISANFRVSANSQPNYFTRFWQVGDNGLPENNVTAVVQTHDGYL